MPEYIEVRLHGVDNLKVLHLNVTIESAAIVDRLTVLEQAMSELNDAVAANTAAQNAAFARITEDVDHLRQLVEDAIANDAADAATIAQLRADADAAVASINANTAALNAEDPDPSFPPAPPTP